jgi:hypothetical protein
VLAWRVDARQDSRRENLDIVAPLTEGSSLGALGVDVSIAQSLMARLGWRGPATSAAAKTSAAPIGAIGILTADRPQLAERAVSECRSHCGRWGRSSEVFVIDGSAVPTHQTRTREIVAMATGAVPVHYVGFEERTRLVERLAPTAPQCVHDAIGSGSAGANRNTLLLLTAGTPCLMVDDDILWRTWRAADSVPTPGLIGHVEPWHATFFSTRAAALAAARMEDVDLLAVHEQYLGRSAKSLLLDGLDCRRACSHLLRELDSREWSVRATMTGIAGDSGTYCPYQLLFTRGRTRSDLIADSDKLTTALSSREVLRVARRPEMTHEHRCMAGCIGLGNDRLLPPFMPRWRSEDAVFGALLAAAYPESLFAHLAWGVVHDSLRPARRDELLPISALETRTAEILLGCLRGFTTDEDDPLGVVARHVDRLATATRDDFRGLVRHIVDVQRQRELAELNRQLDSHETPEHWRNAINTYRASLLRRLREASFYEPVEFAPCADPLMKAQNFIRDFAEVIGEWSALWTHAKRLGPRALLA